jgi:transposase
MEELVKVVDPETKPYQMKKGECPGVLMTCILLTAYVTSRHKLGCLSCHAVMPQASRT